MDIGEVGWLCIERELVLLKQEDHFKRDVIHMASQTHLPQEPSFAKIVWCKNEIKWSVVGHGIGYRYQGLKFWVM